MAYSKPNFPLAAQFRPMRPLGLAPGAGCNLAPTCSPVDQPRPQFNSLSTDQLGAHRPLAAFQRPVSTVRLAGETICAGSQQHCYGSAGQVAIGAHFALLMQSLKSLEAAQGLGSAKPIYGLEALSSQQQQVGHHFERDPISGFPASQLARQSYEQRITQPQQPCELRPASSSSSSSTTSTSSSSSLTIED